MKLKKIKPLYYIVAIQVIIVFYVMLIYLLNRGNAFQRSFGIDDFLVSENTQVVEEVTIKDGSSQEGIFLNTSDFALEKGTYIISIDYTTNKSDNNVSIYSKSLSTLEYHTTPINLNPADNNVSMTVEVDRYADDFVIQSNYCGTGDISIRSITIAETSHLYKKNIFYAFIICLLINGIYIFKGLDLSSKKITLALSVIFLVSCYPIYTDYLTVGADLPFHLLRIEGLKEGISSGYLPVKIHPVWAKDYGYAAGIFYGDLLLYLPAFLRILGFSIQTSYKIYLMAINLGTVIITYFCFKKVFNSRKSGVFGSLIYSLSLYRLANLYIRSAVGEYTAMMFLPVVLLGFYLIFTSGKDKNWWKNSVITAIGITGLVQSHILSCEMLIFLLIITIIVLLPYVIKWHTFKSLLLGALLSILFNVGFLVPFLSFYNGDIMINSPEWTGNLTNTLQSNGLFVVQLFNLFQKNTGGAWSTQAGINNEATYALGIVFLAGIILFSYLLICHYKTLNKDKNFKPACLCFALGLITLYMSTCHFPWDAIVSLGGIAEKLANSLQFPWRMLGPASILLTFVLCYALKSLYKVEKEQIYNFVILICSMLFIINTGWFLYDFTFTGAPYRVYDTYEINSMSMYSYEYLPTGTNPQEIADNRINMEGIVSFENYNKHNLDIQCYVAANANGGYIEFPLNYYKNYRCVDMTTSEELDISAGYNNMVKITLPGNYSGNISISYKEPWFWRLSEIISLLTTVVVIILILKNRKKQ